MTDHSESRRVKFAHDDHEAEITNEERSSKAKRHDVEVPMAEVDIKLAAKLDNLLKISNSKPRFLTNKTKESCPNTTETSATSKREQSRTGPTLKSRNLTKDELQERLIQKYDTLVPELDPGRHKIKVVKILTASESIELGKDQARKQMERQLELSSVFGNQQAHKSGFKSFKFNDGYETPTSSKGDNSKSVRFADTPTESDSDVSDLTDSDEAD